MEYFKETVQLLANSSIYYSIAIGMDSTYMYVSPSYDKNFDFTKSSLLGKEFHITLHPDDVKICAEVGGKCFENPGQLFPATLRKHNGKGNFITTQWEFKALFDSDNNPAGIFCIGYNITEYVDTRDMLQNEIEHKTDQLNQIGYLQSHVIRKPLANILGLTQVLGSMEIDPSLHTIKTLLVTSADELDTVIKDIIAKAEE